MEKLVGAMLRRMLRQHALARVRGNAAQLRIREVECRRRLCGVARDQDLGAGREKFIEPRPPVAQDGRAARGRTSDQSG